MDNFELQIRQMSYRELDHLKDKEPIVKKIYEQLIKEMKKLGDLKIEAHKTSIHLVNRFAFVGIYTRKKYKS